MKPTLMQPAVIRRVAVAALAPILLVAGLAGCTNKEIAREAIERHFPERQEDKAMRVARCESGYDPKAVSPDGENHGLFQINEVHKPLVRSMGYRWRKIYDPYVNTKVARRLWDDSRWEPWAACA